jgi:hypothetical protein
MENKQTAIEWLIEQWPILEAQLPQKLIDQAKAMERDQIEQAHEDAFISMNMAFRAAHRAEAYYDETYSAQK